MQPNQASFKEAGRAFEARLAKFNEFLDRVVALAQQVPSLVIDKRGEGQLEFCFLGEQYCIRHQMVEEGGRWHSKVHLLTKGWDDEKYVPRSGFEMDEGGSIGVDGHWPWSVHNDSETVFYELVCGTPGRSKSRSGRGG